jgi:hypothetical protein
MTPDQLPNETSKAYAAFKAYCDLGPQRSIPALSRVYSRSIPLLKGWSRKHHWQKRVVEYDAASARTSHEAEEEALKKEAGFWAKAQIEHRKKSFNLGEAILAVAAKELQKIASSSRIATLGDVARSIQIADTLKRLSLNLPTEKTELSGPDNTPLAIHSAASVVIVLPENGRDTPQS